MATARALKSKKKPSTQLSLLSMSYGRSYNPYWSSSLFNQTYLTNDLPTQHKEIWTPRDDEAGQFQQFLTQFQNIAVDVKSLKLDSLNEENTINRFIKPVLSILGWIDPKKPYQLPYIENESFSVEFNGATKAYRPDILIFDSNNHVNYFSSRSKDEKLDAAKKHTLIPIEAKYWNRIEEKRQNQDGDTKRGDKGRKDDTLSNDFEGQILRYMEIVGKEWGILTDGYTWKLFHSELSADSQRRCFQFNLGHLLKAAQASIDEGAEFNEEFREHAKYFYYFFGKESHVANGNGLLSALIANSKKYAASLEEDLKQRFLKAMSIGCNGYARAMKAAGEKPDLELIRNVSESHLFNIFFIKFCETGNILPIKQAPAEYRLLSITNTMDKLAAYDPEAHEFGIATDYLQNAFSDFKFKTDGYELYERFQQLTDIIEMGSGSIYSGFEIRGFKKTIYSVDERKFARKFKLTNAEMISIYFELGYKKEGKAFKQIPYNFFTPRQLGSIYESFLEFRLEIADQDLVFLKKQWQPANLKSEKIRLLDVPKAKKGELFFSPDNKDRKATGSFYTPDYVVQDIVHRVVGPLVKDASEKELIGTKVVDPAMGSGHFLCGALNYLASQYLSVLEEDSNDDLSIDLAEAKRLLVGKCVVGFDINPRAVKLAKMSLWLESAVAGKPLEDLDDQLQVADTIFEKHVLKKVSPIINPKGITAVVGNPPYGIDFTDDQVEELFKRFKTLHQKHDSFHVFMERVLFDESWLSHCDKENYRMGFIIPDTILSLDCFKKFREALLSSGFDVDFITTKYEVFEDAKVNTVIMIVNSICDSETTIRLATSHEPSDLSNVELEAVDIDGCRTDSTNRIILRRKSPLNGLSATIDDFFEATAGAQAYEVGKGTPKQSRKMLDEKVYNSLKKINKDYRPYLYGNDIKLMQKIWRNKEYIQYGPNLSAPRDPKFHEGDRVVIQRIRNPKLDQRIVAAFIDDNSVSSVGLSIIKPKPECAKKVSARALSVYLNLPSVNSWFKQVNSDVNVKPTVLKTIPVTEELLAFGGLLDREFTRLNKLAQSCDEAELRVELAALDKKVFAGASKKRSAA